MSLQILISIKAIILWCIGKLATPMSPCVEQIGEAGRCIKPVFMSHAGVLQNHRLLGRPGVACGICSRWPVGSSAGKLSHLQQRIQAGQRDRAIWPSTRGLHSFICESFWAEHAPILSRRRWLSVSACSLHQQGRGFAFRSIFR